MEEVREQIASAPHKKLMAICLALTLDDRIAGAVRGVFSQSAILDDTLSSSVDGIRSLMGGHPYVRKLADSLRRLDFRDGLELGQPENTNPSTTFNAATNAPTRSPRTPPSGRSAGRSQTSANRSFITSTGIL
jgi:hypothetical protein